MNSDRSFLNQLGDGVIVGSKEGIILFANEACCELLGYESPGLMDGQKIHSIIQIPRQPSLVEDASSPLPMGKSAYRDPLHAIAKTKNGEPMGILATVSPIKWEGKPGAFLITMKKPISFEQADSAGMLKEILENINNGIAVYECVNDCEDFIFLDINPAGEIFSGIVREEVLGKSVLKLFPAIEKMGLYDVFRRVCKNGDPEYLPMSLYEDERLTEWVTNYVYRIPGGKIVAIYNDVTQEKTAQVELEKINRTLEQRIEVEVEKRKTQEDMLMHSIRLGAMGEMLQNIAHHWRQPLSALSLIIQDMDDAGEFGVLDRAYLEDAVEQSMMLIKELSATIDRFLDFFRKKEEKETYNPGLQIIKTVRLIKARLDEQGIEIGFECNGGGLRPLHELEGDPEHCMRCKDVDGYPVELSNVLMNLINNAREAIQQVRNQKGPGFSGRIEIRMECTESNVHIEIEDNGGGIPAQYEKEIYKPYFSTKGVSHGIGLGLFMARIIAERQMGGRLFHRQKGEGACFILDFPSKQGESLASEMQPDGS